MMHNSKSRHIRRRHNTVRELLSSEIITVNYVKSKDNVSNPLTKGLSREGVERTSKGMGLRPRTSQHDDLALSISSLSTFKWRMTYLVIELARWVATLARNVYAMQELHFAVPMAGAVICTLNSRLDSAMISVLLRHSEAKIIFVDQKLLQVAQGALDILAKEKAKPPLLVLISDSDSSPTIVNSVTHVYESLLESGSSEFSARWPTSEFDPISINYTSGTTSRPKGVVYNHRGAYLNTIATFMLHEMSSWPVYLWTVPTFHCNGWCLTWGLAALGGTSICLRQVSPRAIFEYIAGHKVTHMSAAPIVMNMIVNSPVSDRKPLPHKVNIMTGGSPPPPQILSKMEELGFRVHHLYGLTETYGPGTYCLWKPEWDSLPPHEKYKLKARQGVQHLCSEGVDVMDPLTLEKVPQDGKTMGEIMFRGNTVMSGYLKDVQATEEAFKGGWFHSGDLAVKHPDGYIEVKDRLKDIIISGGENISTVEVERVLYSHPAVLETAVVARPDNHWGQTPCAYVKLKDDSNNVSDQEIINFCRDNLPHYMAPRTVDFLALAGNSILSVHDEEATNIQLSFFASSTLNWSSHLHLARDACCCIKLASALSELRISRGDVVATLAPNVYAMLELHFAVPMSGAVLCTLNIRHDSAMISAFLKHSEAKVIFVDRQLLQVAQGALDILANENQYNLFLL
ncbi:putative acyl-activating enzyme 1, peroxisomal [Capsicum annuum]|nr:putative acyl-activating enzyme 1, peroxisomal [Capsicum annuum]